MPRECALTGKRVRYGNNVSHSNRKSSRPFKPNLQRVTLPSDALCRKVSLRISTRALRTVVRKGGLDAFLLGSLDANLGTEGLRLKRQVRKAISGSSAG